MAQDRVNSITKKDLKSRTKEFALRCIKLCNTLPSNWVGNHLKIQLFKCSTSVVANYRAACAAQSRKSFLSKLGIVVEEADESCFWIEFILAAKLLTARRCQPLLNEAQELTAIFTASQKTARRNNKLKM